MSLPISAKHSVRFRPMGTGGRKVPSSFRGDRISARAFRPIHTLAEIKLPERLRIFSANGRTPYGGIPVLAEIPPGEVVNR